MGFRRAPITVYYYSMKARVVQLYKGEFRLSRKEAKAAEPICGELLVDFDGTLHTDYRLQARLYEIQAGWRRTVLPPLFAPQVVRIAKGNIGMVLRGHQYQSRDDGTIAEYVQEWWVRLDKG